MKKSMCVILLLAISGMAMGEEDVTCDKVADAMMAIEEGKAYLNGGTPADKEKVFQLAVNLKTTYGDEVARQALYLYDIHREGMGATALTHDAAEGMCMEFYE